MAAVAAAESPWQAQSLGFVPGLGLMVSSRGSWLSA